MDTGQYSTSGVSTTRALQYKTTVRLPLMDCTAKNQALCRPPGESTSSGAFKRTNTQNSARYTPHVVLKYLVLYSEMFSRLTRTSRIAFGMLFRCIDTPRPLSCHDLFTFSFVASKVPESCLRLTSNRKSLFMAPGTGSSAIKIFGRFLRKNAGMAYSHPSSTTRSPVLYTDLARDTNPANSCSGDGLAGCQALKAIYAMQMVNMVDRTLEAMYVDPWSASPRGNVLKHVPL